MSNLNECTDRTTHFEIVNNPDIEEFLSNCSYMIEPTNEEAKQMAALFSTLPIYDEELQLPVNIFLLTEVIMRQALMKICLLHVLAM